MIREPICERCKKPFVTNHAHKKYCDSCKPLVINEYQSKYRKNYNATRRFDTTITKRNYTRTKLKNETRQKTNIFIEYCRDNHMTVEGCLNCIASECLQPETGDSFLIWEKEGFFEDKKQKIKR